MKFFINLWMALFFLLFFTASGSASQYWQVNEIVVDIEASNGGGYNVYFEVLNEHDAESFRGFGVGIDMSAIPSGYEIWATSPQNSSIWHAERISTSSWNADGDSYYLGGQTYQEYFGGISWADAFGEYENAYLAFLNITDFTAEEIAAAALAAGQTMGGSGGAFYYSASNMPASPAIIVTGSGTAYAGETEIHNIFPTSGSSAVPEPTTVLLFGFGLLGFARVSRKKG